MLSWASSQIEKLSEAVAPPPTDAISRFLYCVQRGDEDEAMGCLAEFDPLTQVIQPTKGTLPIHLACLHGMLRLIRRILVIPGASVEVYDLTGNTPLHYAGMSTNTGNGVNVVRMLVTEYNASVIAKNSSGQTPYDVSTLNGIRQYLLPLQLQKETQQALDNGGVGLPPGIDMGGLRVNRAHVPPPPIGGMGMPPTGGPNGGPPPATPTYGSPYPQYAPPSAPGATQAPPPPAQQGPPSALNDMLSSPSPTHLATASRSQSAPTTQHSEKPPVRAPTSGNANAEKYAMASTGASHSGNMLSDSKYRPDGFHSSSSDVSLQQKYGHVGAGPASNIPPPPSSGNSAGPGGGAISAPPSLGSGGSNPFAAGMSAFGAGNRPGRYPVYQPGHAAVPQGGYAPPYGAAPAAAPVAAPLSFTVFSPTGQAPQQQHQQPVGYAPPVQQQQPPSAGYAPPAPSPVGAAGGPTTPFMPPPPYQSQPAQVPAPTAYAPPQQAADFSSTAATANAASTFSSAPVAQSVPAIPAPNSTLQVTTTGGSVASAQELFANPSPSQSASKTVPAEPQAEPAPTGGATFAAAVGPNSPEEVFGTAPQVSMETTSATETTTEAANKTDATAGPEQPAANGNAADFFGSSPSSPEPTKATSGGQTTEPLAQNKQEKSSPPGDDLDDVALEDVSLLSPSPKVEKDIANGEAEADPAAQPSEQAFSSLVMPPPPFSTSSRQ